MSKKLYLLLIIFFIVGCKKDSKAIKDNKRLVSFEREKVDISIERIGDNIYRAVVKGEYIFRTESKREVSLLIYFPFFIKNGIEYPYKIEVNNGKTKFIKRRTGISFKINIMPQKVERLFIKYYQKIRGDLYGYITTTAKAWGKALKYAEFKIVLKGFYDKDVKIVPNDFIKIKEKELLIFKAKYKNFLPSHDIIISWNDH